MMTTKVFQRFLATFLVVAAIFLANGLNNVANAAIVQLYDGKVNDIINDIKKHSEKMNFNFWGTHYYTGTDGFKYCESYFGESKKNRLIFRLNNNGAVSSAWIIVSTITPSGELNRNSLYTSGALEGSIHDIVGLSNDESKELSAKRMEWARLNEGNTMNRQQTFTIWCSKSNRYVNEQLTINEDTHTSFIYAHT